MDIDEIEREIERFDAELPIASAWTPPSTWYTAPEFLERERSAVFRASWIFACRADQVRERGARVTTDVLGDAYVVVRGDDGVLRGFHNVCRHHAARVADGEACVEELVCPYHGWTYNLDGSLKSAPRSAGLQDFERERYGLVPVQVEEFGPLVFLHAGYPERTVAEELADLVPFLDPAELAGMRWVLRRTYPMQCNWKVFVDNYLDGGYHISHLHHGLASQLDLTKYKTEVFGRFNVQTCPSHEDPGASVGKDLGARIGEGAVYAWIYPNLMLNRYGPTLDTNLVVPVGPDRCEVVFDYWFQGDGDDAFVDDSLATSDETQQEDVWVSEQVQRGLNSAAYDSGRYAPTVEHGMYHFHRLLAADLRASAL